MGIAVTVVVVVIIVAIVAYNVGRSTGDTDGYWKGRLAGWQACEARILAEAEKHPDYDRKKIWTDLVQ